MNLTAYKITLSEDEMFLVLRALGHAVGFSQPERADQYRVLYDRLERVYPHSIRGAAYFISHNGE